MAADGLEAMAAAAAAVEEALAALQQHLRRRSFSRAAPEKRCCCSTSAVSTLSGRFNLAVSWFSMLAHPFSADAVTLQA